MYKSLYWDDPKPRYCTKCRKELVPAELSAGWNAYTGEQAIKKFSACPDAIRTLLDTHHDVWEVMDEDPPLIRMAYV